MIGSKDPWKFVNSSLEATYHACKRCDMKLKLLSNSSDLKVQLGSNLVQMKTNKYGKCDVCLSDVINWCNCQDT